MTRAVKHDGQGKGRVLKRPQSGELTCSEGQVEDMLSEHARGDSQRIECAHLK